MAVDPATLTAEILKLTDETNPDFVGFPPDNETTAINWAAAISAYLATLTTPPGGGLAAVAAEGTAASAMEAALDAGGIGLVELFAAFGVAIAVIPVSVAGVFSLTPLPPSALVGPPAASLAGDATKWVAAGTWTAPAPGSSPIPWA